MTRMPGLIACGERGAADQSATTDPRAHDIERGHLGQEPEIARCPAPAMIRSSSNGWMRTRFARQHFRDACSRAGRLGWQPRRARRLDRCDLGAREEVRDDDEGLHATRLRRDASALPWLPRNV
jgi:hypothetical protein